MSIHVNMCFVDSLKTQKTSVHGILKFNKWDQTIVYIPGPDLYIDRGSTINLTCTVKYSPEPPHYIIWNHNNAVSRLAILLFKNYYKTKNYGLDYTEMTKRKYLQRWRNSQLFTYDAYTYIHMYVYWNVYTTYNISCATICALRLITHVRF